MCFAFGVNAPLVFVPDTSIIIVLLLVLVSDTSIPDTSISIVLVLLLVLVLDSV